MCKAFWRAEADWDRSSHEARRCSALLWVCLRKSAVDPTSGPRDLRRRWNSRADERQIVQISRGRNRPFAKALTAWDENCRHRSVRRYRHGIHDLRGNYRHLRYGYGRQCETRHHGSRHENPAGHADRIQRSECKRGRMLQAMRETGILWRWVSAFSFPPPNECTDPMNCNRAIARRCGSSSAVRATRWPN